MVNGDEAQNIKPVDKPQELIALADKLAHPRSLGGEVCNRLMIPMPLLEKLNGVFLIFLVLRAGTATRKKKVWCQSEVQEGRVTR
jgi:hypothetical protein